MNVHPRADFLVGVVVYWFNELLEIITSFNINKCFNFMAVYVFQPFFEGREGPQVWRGISFT